MHSTRLLLITLLLTTLSLSSRAQTAPAPKAPKAPKAATATTSLSATAATTVAVAEDDSVYAEVDTAAAFPGGNEALIQWLSAELKYPESAKEAGLAGVVISTFIVEKDGSVSTIEIVRSLDPACDAEVVRLLQQSPPWIPAKRAGQIVRMQMALPVKFALDKPKSNKKK